MKLKLIHGRKNPEENLEQWGYDASPILGVKYVHVTYMHHYLVGFKTREALRLAQAQTGWPEWDSEALLMKITDDMVETLEGFFGDWELQEDSYE
jgi:hypothetical protein